MNVSNIFPLTVILPFIFTFAVSPSQSPRTFAFVRHFHSSGALSQWRGSSGALSQWRVILAVAGHWRAIWKLAGTLEVGAGGEARAGARFFQMYQLSKSVPNCTNFQMYQLFKSVPNCTNFSNVPTFQKCTQL